METVKTSGYTVGFGDEGVRGERESEISGIVPRLMRVFATSSDELQAYLNFKDPSDDNSLDAKVLDGIAFAVADVNRCNCCGSVHAPALNTATLQEVAAQEPADLKDLKIETALEFARKIVIRNGEVSDSELEVLFLVGYSARDIVKIVANVALHRFSNCWNHVSQLVAPVPGHMHD